MYNNLEHIALILDGNKRWAKKNNLQNIDGYTNGFKNIKNLARYSLSLKIPNLTIYTLSSENFNRSSVNLIYNIIYDNFSSMLQELVEEKGVKINIFGSRDNLPKKLVEIFNKIEKLSFNNNDLNLNIAFNYGFKDEIKNIINNVSDNKNKINYENDY